MEAPGAIIGTGFLRKEGERREKGFTVLFHRVVIVAVFIAIQVLILVGIIWRFNNYFVYFYAFSILLSVLVLLWIINNRSNPAYKIA